MRQRSVSASVLPEVPARSRTSVGRVGRPIRRWPGALLCASALAFAGAAGCSGDFDPGDVAMSSADWARHIQQGGDTTTGETTSALLMGTPKRTRTIAAMMFDISGGPPNATTITNVVSGTGSSQRHMYLEASYGLQDLQADILGPYTLPVANCLTIACCGPSSDRTGNGSTVSQLISGLGKTYDHYFWVYGKIPSGADCGTWGDEGNPNNPGKYSSYSFHELVGYAQEIGHNFGMTHEPTLTCSGGATFLDDSSQCTHVEYGSTLSFMGNGSRHPSAYHKYAQGWIGKCNVVKGGAGTFTLVPQELPCDGVQLLQIPAPKTRAAPAKGDRQGSGPMLSNYYLEMRSSFGFDGSLKPQVVISIGAGLPTTNQPAPYLYVLDMKPESGRADLSNAGLMTTGQSYADPGGGLTITLDSIDTMSATVTITGPSATAPTCADSSSFTAPGPGGESCGSLVGTPSDGGVSTGGTTGTGSGGAGGRVGGSGGRVGGTGGAGGMTGAGTGGTAGGTGGRAATGSGGATGTGTGGSTTGAGSGGTTGGGTGGSTGTGGSGSGGSTTVTGSGGSTGTGSGGATSTGSGGASTGTGTGGITPPPDGGPGETPTVSGGCGCEVSGAARSTAPLAWVLVLAGLMIRRRSRRGRG